MNKFNGIHQNTKKLPEKGDKIYLVPIRYYDKKHNAPIEFDFDHVSDSVYAISGQKSGINFYGFSHEYKDNVYIMDISDASWYYEKENAVKAINLLLQVHEIVRHDDFHHLFETKILPTIKKNKKDA